VETPAAASAPEPVTLRLAVSDQQGNASEPPVQEFIHQVKTLSNGEIIIEPIWDAADESQAGFEGRVIQLVRGGQADLGLAASRAWTSEGINSFEALQAPFLIDNDTLAQAIARSDIATRMLEDLSESGLVGLTLWLEDLRHPFSLLPEKPILSPADIAGRNMRVTDTGISQKLIETLGGIPTTGEDGYDGAESGLRQTRTLSGTPTATGNVTFFPKYQVLFADGAAFDKLSESQQAILREAAAAAQERAIAEHPSEVEAAKTWCSDAGAVALASDEQIAAFEEAAQPVFAAIEQDPQNAELIAAIRELKTKTPPSPGVQACDYELAQQIRTPDAIAQTWSTGLPPNGTWQVTLTNDEVINMGVSKAKAPDWSGVYSFTFQDGVFHWTWEGTEGYAKGQTASLDGSYEVVEDFVRMTSGDVVDDVQWRLDEEGLHFHLLATQNDPFVEIRAMLEARPYQKVADT
jgi:TRAP-type C4-dicarboxylate transport system substrate-binding protein